MENGRSIAPIINRLLRLPFRTRIATQDYHPSNHCSFASQHPGAEPFTSTHSVRNPEASANDHNAEQQTIVLWPDHCVQGTSGCEFIPEVDFSLVDHVVRKGEDTRVEAYSGFGPPFRKPAVAMSNFPKLLSESAIKRVFVCGLALDYCVKCTAIDAADAGYETFVVEDATKAVDSSDDNLKAIKSEMQDHGVTFILSTSMGLKL